MDHSHLVLEEATMAAALLGGLFLTAAALALVVAIFQSLRDRRSNIRAMERRRTDRWVD